MLWVGGWAHPPTTGSIDTFYIILCDKVQHKVCRGWGAGASTPHRQHRHTLRRTLWYVVGGGRAHPTPTGSIDTLYVILCGKVRHKVCRGWGASASTPHRQHRAARSFQYYEYYRSTTDGRVIVTQIVTRGGGRISTQPARKLIWLLDVEIRKIV
jgi:hypothetical protein